MTQPHAARLRAAVHLGGDAVGFVASRVEEIHRDIAAIPYATLERIPVVRGPARIVRGVDSGIKAVSYGAVRTIAHLASRIGGALAAPVTTRVPLSPTVESALTHVGGIAAGLVGDALLRQRSRLMPRMALHEPADPARAGNVVAESAPHTLVVYVHGLCCSELSWAPTDLGPGFKTLRLRYNTGLPVQANGRRLSRCLEAQLRRDAATDRLVLVGHSMGGLVIRAAVDHAGAQGKGWLGRLSGVATLGSPHRGAPLARHAASLARLAQLRREAGAIGSLLSVRSAGIRDLASGMSGGHAAPRIQWLQLAGHLGARRSGWAARLLGDGLVPVDSALAAIAGDVQQGCLPSTQHMALLGRGDSGRIIAEWISTLGHGEAHEGPDRTPASS